MSGLMNTRQNMEQVIGKLNVVGSYLFAGGKVTGDIINENDGFYYVADSDFRYIFKKDTLDSYAFMKCNEDDMEEFKVMYRFIFGHSIVIM